MKLRFNLFKKNKKKELSPVFVDLSFGRVYFFNLNYGIVNRALTESTIYGSIINNNMFFSKIEQEITDLSKEKLNNLSIQDGNKLREKVKEILKINGIMKDTKKTSGFMFNDDDIEWFDKSETEMKRKIGI